MGEQKHRQWSRKRVLEKNPWCIYCGAPAVTTDHCPPRAIFRQRAWPETYEFSCCAACNDEGRLDEQVVAVLARIRSNNSELDDEEFEKQARGLKNNQPDIMAEWVPLSRNAVLRQLRENLGDLGDELRRAGWGGMTLGPLTCAALDRFCHRLAKALYFREVGERFDGVIFARRHSVADGSSFDVLAEVAKFAPMVAGPLRARKRLSDQFEYCFNASNSIGALYAVAEFNPQMIFQIIALSTRAVLGFNEYRATLGQDPVPMDQEGVRLMF